MQQYDLQGNVYDIKIHNSYEKTADEMFEALGFKKYLNKYDKERKKEYGYEVFFRYKKDMIEIAFDCLDMSYAVYGTIIGRGITVEITMELHKAINQKCKELGWLDE